MSWEDIKAELKKEKKEQKAQNPKKKKIKKAGANLGWLFYRDYFRDLDFNDLSNNEELIKRKINTIISSRIEIKKRDKLFPKSKVFFLKTRYPGLLLGSGYIHELPKIKEQAILGFDFDYTTGAPIIRGSSIKGLLRSAFLHKEYIDELLDELRIEKKENIEQELFENGKVIFLDAEIVRVGSDGVLKDDYITPHKSEFEDPKPLRFIKVAPGVTFEFRFIFKEEYEEYLELFKRVILDLGLGAKTNVGYGKFEEVQ